MTDEIKLTTKEAKQFLDIAEELGEIEVELKFYFNQKIIDQKKNCFVG